MNYPKRLIEVDLPISRISAHARREKSIRHGHISTLHTWWARRPLAACRAVILASLWPDPVDLATWQQQAGSSQEVHAPRTEDAEPSEGVDIQPARFLDEARSQMNRSERMAHSEPRCENQSRSRTSMRRGSREEDAIEAVKQLHTLVQGTVFVFKDFEIRNGALVRKGGAPTVGGGI